MKKIIFLILLLFPSLVNAQFGVSIHQTSLPFVGANYEINDRLRPEIRLGTDTYFEDISGEIVLTYDVINKEDFEVYAGAGARVGNFEGVPIPVGINVFPFEIKKFGFHIEVAPLIGEDAILRGSWGIRYKFTDNE